LVKRSAVVSATGVGHKTKTGAPESLIGVRGGRTVAVSS
jgi:hypothetical protein